MVVPGNHDVNWKLSEAYFAQQAGNEAKPALPYWPKLQPYADFFARFYEGQPGFFVCSCPGRAVDPVRVPPS